MDTIKNFFIFLGIWIAGAIGINLLFRAGAFLFNGTFCLDESTSQGALVIGFVVGIILAIYHFADE